MRTTSLLNLRNCTNRWKLSYVGQYERTFSIISQQKNLKILHCPISQQYSISSQFPNNPFIQNRFMFTSNTRSFKSSAMEEASVKDLLLVKIVENNIRSIKLNRPAKKNALNSVLFKALTNAIIDGNNDSSTNIIVLTGSGDYFCAGADTKEGLGTSDEQNFKYLVAALIDCKKPIIVILNGPAVGIGVTLLGLCDIIYSSDLATFWTPFSQLGICAEACSSYTFPRIMGYAKACDLLLFGTKINASQADSYGLVTQVFPNAQLEDEAWRRIKAMGELPIKSLIYSKELVRGPQRELLHEVNENEAKKLKELAALKNKT